MTEQEYISLIVKECNNDITSAELSALGSWLEADSEHQKIYTAFKKDWQKADAYKSNIKINKAKAWQNIESKISSPQETKVVSMSQFKKWYKIAAVFVVILASTFFVKNFVVDNGIVVEKTAQNETKSIQLPDGSTVVLNESSSLKYKKTFATRDVSLKGEAFFEVVKDEKHPFNVNVNETNTQVLGTSFNIDAKQKGKVEVALLTGKVKFSNSKDNAVVLNPGETAVYDKQTAIFSMDKSNNQNSISWKTNKLVFENTNLFEVVENLNDYYDTEIALASKNSNCRFTGTFENAKVSEVLEVISFSLNAELAFTNNVYTIQSVDCQ